MTDQPGYVDPETGEIRVPRDTPSTDVEVVGDAALVNTPARMPEKLAAMLADAQDRTTQDPEEISQAIVERILRATSAEEVLAQQDVRHARELLGEPIIIESVRFNESDFKDGYGFYMLVDYSDSETGDRGVASCGGRTVMAQLYRLAELGALPCKVRFMQPEKPTRQGYYPLWLQPA